MPDTLSTLTPEAKQYYDKRMLMRAKQSQVYYDLGQKRNIPRNGGNQVSYRRLNTLTVNTTALTEGVTPLETALSMIEVTGTVASYGAYVSVSDNLDLMGIDPIIMETTEVIGQQAGESVETIVTNELVTGTSVIYATGTTRGAQSGANPFTLRLLKRAIRTLDRNNTRRFSGETENKKIYTGKYICVFHPDVVFDLMNDSEIVSAITNNANNTIMWQGQFGEVLSVTLVESTLAPVFSAAGSGGADVYATLMFGMEAFGVVDVAGTGKFETVAKQLGSAGTSDPLNQRATIGWKSRQLPKILNNNFFVRIESGASS